ncbi:hypothetical protein [Paenibacillus sp. KS-LC4]|uniref:hypothetical protein n=1 Tax=Paenibacillus sp. KS-LC4 TaxID=2979727 RepID=UPI0030D5D0A6
MRELHPTITEQMRQYVLSSNQIQHFYMYACLMEQRLSDSYLSDRSELSAVGADDDGALAVLRKHIVQLASKLMAREKPSWNELHLLEEWKSFSDRWSLQPESEENDLFDLLGEIRTPECSGYDLCDVEVCYYDARNWLLAMWDLQYPPLLIGIRTGGGYYAPFWSLACQQRWSKDVPYYTVRAMRKRQSIHFSDAELALLPNLVADEVKIVIIDDQPHTGETVIGLAKSLKGRYGESVSIWVASPGRLFRVNGLCLEKLSERLPLVNKSSRIWELLEDPEAIIPKINEVSEFSELSFEDMQVEPHTNLKYWSHPSLKDSSPLRINPKKTPFTIRCKRDRRIMMFGKFIGKDLFGEFQFEQLRHFSNWMPRRTSYKDGYLLTGFVDGLLDIRDYVSEGSISAKLDIAAQVCGYWEMLHNHFSVSSRTDIGGVADTLWADIDTAEQGLKSRLPVDRSWFQRSLEERAGHSNPVYSSLPYSHPHWHWKYMKAQQPGERSKVYRFHIDSTWGGMSSIELEIASFILSNRLDVNWIRKLLDIVASKFAGITTESVIHALPMAYMLHIRTLLKQKKILVPPVSDEISSDLMIQLQWMNRIKLLLLSD